MGEHSFSQISSFFSLTLQHRPSGSASLCARPLPYLVACQHPCHTVPSYTLPSAWVSYPDHRAKKEGGEEKKEKWCHTAMMPEHWAEERWKEREYREKEGREEEAAVPWEFSHWGQKQGMPSHPPCPLAAPAAPHPCPCPSSCAEAAKFEGNTHADTFVQHNSVFLGRLHRGATLGSYLLQWCTTLPSVGRCCLKAFWECRTTR